MVDRDLAWETLLARLFADAEFRARFEWDRAAAARELGLDENALASFETADWVGLDLAARSYARKRQRNSTDAP